MREVQFNEAIGNWGLPLPHSRVVVYRNNVIAALVNALHVRFPVTEQLVGQEFFAAMARAFAVESRPRSPVLIGYGETFPQFIRGFAPASSVPYLSDVASLENLWWRAYHAADTKVSAPGDFAAIPAERWGEARFTFHPAVGQMRSPFAAASIWNAHHGGPGMTEIVIAEAESILVARPGQHVIVRVVSAATHDFIASLATSTSLAETVEQMAAAHQDFDLNTQLQGLLGLGIITGISA